MVYSELLSKCGAKLTLLYAKLPAAAKLQLMQCASMTGAGVLLVPGQAAE